MIVLIPISRKLKQTNFSDVMSSKRQTLRREAVALYMAITLSHSIRESLQNVKILTPIMFSCLELIFDNNDYLGKHVGNFPEGKSSLPSGSLVKYNFYKNNNLNFVT